MAIVDNNPPGASLPRSVVLGAGGGTFIEFYDFSVYGYLAVVMSPLFFPSADPVTSLLASLAVFGTAYFMRPFGSLVFGSLGDRRGRKTALMATLLCMGAASASMALLPTYERVGLLAPALLVLTRLLQGLSAGGENGGAATFISETAPPDRRAYYGSVVAIGGTAGFASAAAVVGVVVSVTTDEQMSDWGWRVPFALSIPLTLFCFWIRRNLVESVPTSVNNGEPSRSPLRGVLAAQPGAVMQVILLAIAVNGASYFGFAYLGIHLSERLGYEATHVYWTATLAIGASAALMPLTGRLADRWGLLKVALVGLLGYTVLTYPAMALMDRGIAIAGLAFFLIMVNTSFLQVAVFAIVPRLFQSSWRYTGVAVGYNIGVMAAGGLAPFVSVLLIETTGNLLAPAFFVLAVSVIGIVAVAWIHRSGALRSPTADVVMRAPDRAGHTPGG